MSFKAMYEFLIKENHEPSETKIPNPVDDEERMARRLYARQYARKRYWKNKDEILRSKSKRVD